MEELNCDLEVTTTEMKKELQRTAETSCISNIFWRDESAERDVAMCICLCNSETASISFVSRIKGMEKKHSSDIVRRDYLKGNISSVV